MTTYYISPVGNDSTGAGTLVSPWATISKAISSATVDDTILCDAGNGNFSWPNSTQTFDYDVIIDAYNGSKAVFDGAGGFCTWVTSAAVTADNITFQNALAAANGTSIFDLDGGSFTFNSCKLKGLLSYWAANYTIFGAIGGTGSFSFNFCLFENCSANPADPVASNDAYFSAVEDCTIALASCTFYSNLSDTLTLSLVNSDGSSDVTSLSLTNCIICNANGTNKSFYVNGTPAATNGSNNDIFGFSSVPSLTDDISADPLFVDPTNSNFNLRPGSPCIDAGTAI